MITDKPTPELLLSDYVEEFIAQSQGWFDIREVYKYCSADNRRKQNTIAVKLNRLVDKDTILKRHETKNGLYRKILIDLPLINWQDADAENIIKLSWPFQLERYIALYPRSVAMVAGSFNAGKTALMFNIIKLNMHNQDLVYFNSEMGPEEMKSRIAKFGLEMGDWKFKAFERSTNFADVIFPDAINLIDYLEVTTDFYLVAEEITAIWNKLHKGLAIIAVQKKRGQELGRGAEFSAEKPRLYLTMDSGAGGKEKSFGKLKVVKAKNWVCPTVNPNGLEWEFRLHNGCEFEVMSEPVEGELE